MGDRPISTDKIHKLINWLSPRYDHRRILVISIPELHNDVVYLTPGTH